MFKMLFGLFGLNKKASVRSISKKEERAVVASLSRGNIHLQNGSYLLEKDIDEMRKKAFI
jgi:hypothetical protein